MDFQTDFAVFEFIPLYFSDKVQYLYLYFTLTPLKYRLRHVNLSLIHTFPSIQPFNI